MDPSTPGLVLMLVLLGWCWCFWAGAGASGQVLVLLMLVLVLVLVLAAPGLVLVLVLVASGLVLLCSIMSRRHQRVRWWAFSYPAREQPLSCGVPGNTTVAAAAGLFAPR